MDRSDKIRTYNYVQVGANFTLVCDIDVEPQDRVTDHRTGFSTMNLSNVMDGEGLEAVIDSCRKRNEEEIMASLWVDN